LVLPNRIVMAPMTRYFSPNGVPGRDVAEYYARRARAGVGLLITEGTYPPHPSAHAYENVPEFYGAAALDGWRSVLEEVRAAGGRIFPQLWHTGPVREAGMPPEPAVAGFGPSPGAGIATKVMSDRDIAEVIQAYVQSASDAKRMGFDGIEIHGAHGYLIDSFFWDRTNRRTDMWGGDLVQRARFAVEIVRAIRREVGGSFPISFRWSQFKQQDYRARLADTPQQLEPFLQALADAGVTLFHASARRFWEPAFPDHSDLTLAGWTKKLSGCPAIAVGSVGLAGVAKASGPAEVPGGGMSFAGASVSDLQQFVELERRLERDEFDLIAVGRSLLADPEWAEKVLGGRFEDRIAFEKAQLKQLI
tara:strand:+ start:3253 stop:4338 length:1086 start_codon:yes stop_codon:yes gene_type:complete